MASDGFMGSIKDMYFSFEDKYYDFLDGLNKSMPVYKIIDPIDKVFPSFALLLILIVLFGLLLAFAVIAIIFPGAKLATFSIMDENGNDLSDVEVIVTFADGTTRTFYTDDFGQFSVEIDGEEVAIEIDEEGFRVFSRSIDISGESVTEITLRRDSSSGGKQKTIRIESDSGQPLTGATIRFTCSNNVTPPPTKLSARSVETITVKKECGTITAIVSGLAGYKEKSRILTGLSTVIVMERVQLADIDGTLKVTVVDYETSEAIPGISLRLFTENNIPKGTGQTDATGFHSFQAAPGSYYVRASDSDTPPKYMPGVSETVTIRANQDTTITISLQEIVGEGRKISAIIVDPVTGEPIEGALVGLLEDGALIDTALTDATGLIEFFGLDPDKEYTLTVYHDNRVFEVVEDVETVPNDDTDPIEIEVEVATEENSGKVIVSVRTLEGNALDDAEVILFYSDIDDGIRLGLTDELGHAVFENMPFRNYKAIAVAIGQEGESSTGTLVEGDNLILPITMVVQNGSVDVTVVDREGNLIEGARVKIKNAESNVLEDKITNIDGKIGLLTYSWDVKPIFVVTKEGYYSLETVPYDLIPNDTLKIDLVLSAEDIIDRFKCDVDKELCMELVGKYKENGIETVDKFKADNSYILKFEIIVPNDSADVKSVVRTGLEGNTNASDSIIVIKSISVASASAVKYGSYNSSDNYDESSIEPTNGDGKHAIISFGDLEAGSYRYAVEVYIGETSEEETQIEIRYGARSTSGSSTIYIPAEETLYLEPIILNQLFPCDALDLECSNFVFDLVLTNSDTSEEISLVSGETVELLKSDDISYNLNIDVFNNHQGRKSFSDVTLTLTMDDESITIAPTEFTINQFTHGEAVSRNVILTPNAVDSTSKLTISLDLEEEDNSAEFDFHVAADKTMELIVSPERLIPDATNDIRVTVKDAETQEMLDDATVNWSIASTMDSPNNGAFATTSLPGVYFATISPMEEGEFIYIQAEKVFYQDSEIMTLEVLGSSINNDFTPSEFKCVSLNKTEINISHGHPGTFKLTTDDCKENVDVSLNIPYATSTDLDSGLSGPITMREGSSPINSSYDTSAKTLQKNNDSFEVTVVGDKLLGQYDVEIRLKYAGETDFVGYKLVEVIVGSVSSDEFRISKTTFDILESHDNGVITNKNDKGVSDFWVPRVWFDEKANGDYHAEQSRFTELDYVNFTWSVTINNNGMGKGVIASGNESKFPIETKIYILDSFTEEDIQTMFGAEEIGVITFDVTSDVDTVRVWVEENIDDGFTIKAVITGTAPDASDEISFSVVNDNYRGIDYALLGVKDYVEGEDEPIVRYFHVKIDAGDDSLCYGRLVNGKFLVGETGPSAVPKLLPSWSMNKIDKSTCNKYEDNLSGILNEDYVYCDATQFTSEVLMRIQQMRDDIAEGDFDNLTELKNFDAYLIKDGYSNDFLSDYAAWLGSAFGELGDDYIDSEHGLVTLLNKNKLNFRTIDERTLLPATGLYTVNIQTQWEAEDNLFFKLDPEGNLQPSVNILVTLILKESLETNNLLYNLPIDGSVGKSGDTLARNGYGIGFSGEGDALTLFRVGDQASLNVSDSSGNYLVHINSRKKTAFSELNQGNLRGNLLQIKNNSDNTYDLTYTPSMPTPVAVRVGNRTDEDAAVSFYLDLQDGSSQYVTGLDYLSVWNEISTSMPNCRDFNEDPLFKQRRDEKYTSGSCNLASEGDAFGFPLGIAPLREKLYLSTIFYTPTANYSIGNACDGEGTAVVTTQREISGFTRLDLEPAKINVSSLSDIFELIEEKYVCVSTQNNETNFWWNPDKINKDFKENLSTTFFADMSVCESYDPFGAALPDEPETPVDVDISLSAESISETRINLSWSAVTSATEYLVFVKVGSSGTFAHLTTAETSGSTHSIENLEPGTDYCFKIKPVIGNRSVSQSNEACAKTKLAPPENFFQYPSQNSQTCGRVGECLVFTWGESTGAEKYEVYVTRIIGGESLVREVEAGDTIRVEVGVQERLAREVAAAAEEQVRLDALQVLLDAAETDEEREAILRQYEIARIIASQNTTGGSTAPATVGTSADTTPASGSDPFANLDIAAILQLIGGGGGIEALLGLGGGESDGGIDFGALTNFPMPFVVLPAAQPTEITLSEYETTDDSPASGTLIDRPGFVATFAEAFAIGEGKGCLKVRAVSGEEVTEFTEQESCDAMNVFLTNVTAIGAGLIQLMMAILGLGLFAILYLSSEFG